MILDRAPETIEIYPVEWVDDEYGGGRHPVPGKNPLRVRAFVIPTGFAGAGWAQNIRFQGIGWADTGRITVIVKWRPELADFDVWYQVKVQNRIWTVVQPPRHWNTGRIRFLTALLELKGDAE